MLSKGTIWLTLSTVGGACIGRTGSSERFVVVSVCCIRPHNPALSHILKAGELKLLAFCGNNSYCGLDFLLAISGIFGAFVVISILNICPHNSFPPKTLAPVPVSGTLNS